MVKDGVHWGSFVGVSSVRLAERGFTGIPSILEDPPHAACVDSLGEDWWIDRLYYKLYPCCRWSQPAIARALQLRRSHDLDPWKIRGIRIQTFEAATHLVTPSPKDTEEAQYSLAYPVAAALVHGRFGVAEVTEPFDDPEVLRLSDMVEIVVDPDLDRRFPAEALASVTIETTLGELAREPLPAPGDAEDDVSFDDLVDKARGIVTPVFGQERVERLVEAVKALPGASSVKELTDCLLPDSGDEEMGR